MSREDNGGSAFPFNESIHEATHYGLSMRDYFAAAALPGVIRLCREDSLQGATYEDYVAKNAYDMADAMLKARDL